MLVSGVLRSPSEILLSLSFQNFKGISATFQYSYFWNLYLRVVKNLGLTSRAKPETSLTTFSRCAAVYSDTYSICLCQKVPGFLRHLAERMIEAAAISLGLNWSREASRSEISIRYCAKKKSCRSCAWLHSLKQRSRKRYADGTVTSNSRATSIDISIFKTSLRVNLFSETLSRSFNSGG